MFFLLSAYFIIFYNIYLDLLSPNEITFNIVIGFDEYLLNISGNMIVEPPAHGAEVIHSNFNLFKWIEPSEARYVSLLLFFWGYSTYAANFLFENADKSYFFSF